MVRWGAKDKDMKPLTIDQQNEASLFTVQKGKIRDLRKKVRAARAKHKRGYCEMKSGYTCGACHFYAGSISALSELLGEQGIIS